MPYLDESRLSTYNSNLKEWVSSQESKTLTSSIYPWTKTAKAGAVSCYPVGGTELKPVVDFLFTEVPPASGDKGPENPSTITGVSEVKVGRCGRNLLFLRDVTPVTKNGVTYSVDSNGIITLNGTATSVSSLAYTTDKIPVAANTSLVGTNEIVSGSFSKGSGQSAAFKVQLAIQLADGTVSTPGKLDEGSQVFSINQEGYIYSGAIVVYQGATFSNCKIKSQIEIGVVATSWESPANDIFTLPLGNTYYGGTLDVASGVMTVTWERIVLDGTESGWSAGVEMGTSGVYRYSCNILSSTPKNSEEQACSHFALDYNYSHQWEHFYLSTGGTAVFLFLKESTRESLKAWLASQYSNGAPVTIVYALATPYTVQLTPPQIRALTQADKYTPRLNTLYTDAQSVQVGYVKSPIREEFELQQAIVSQGGNI